ncbi:OmpA family protein [Leptospira gomenensis]|nr:OmpA family protein [Leptospira gomenensis]
MAKKENYYVTIKGKKYDRELIQLAEEFTAERRDGRISVNDAKQLLKAVKDNNSYTEIEKQTIEYIRENYKFTDKSDVWFRTEIRKWAAKRVQETKKKSSSASPSESIVVDDNEAPDTNFPESWGEDKGSIYETPAKDYTNYIPTPSAKPHTKKDRTVPILIFLSGVLILVGLIYFFWTLFSSEKETLSVPVAIRKVAKDSETSKLGRDVSTGEIANQSGNSGTTSASKNDKNTETETKDSSGKTSAASSTEKVGTPTKPESGSSAQGLNREKKSPFSWFAKENSETLSSNPKFRAVESEPIRFEKNSIQVHKESRPNLNLLSRWMREDASLRVKIFGHTSLEGSEAANQKVSQLRAEMVRDYLVGNGISADRFEIIPKGASVPVADDSKEDGKEKNRRVELRIRN